jgi:hypothetical protein
VKKETNSIEFTYERKLKLRLPKFALSKNIRYLNPVKLSKGSHTIELGKFEDCGCDCTVGATIKDGMITGIKHPKCKHAQPIPPKVAKALVAARKKLTKKARRKWQDIPVHDIINNPAVARETTTTIDDGDCVMICWKPPLGGIGEICIICCGLNSPDIHKAWCIGPSEPAFRL